MDLDIFSRFAADLVGRLTGPMTFRLVLQPIMAMLQATKDGLGDARAGRPPYFWSLFTQPALERRRLIQEGLHAVLRVIILGIVMEIAYQLIVFRWVYPGELVAVVLILAFLPYVLCRGPVNRLARWWIGRRARNLV
jgi:hypothetical protein